MQLSTEHRLRETAQGRALLTLLESYPSRKKLAEAIGASVHYVAKCVRDGQVSRSGAILIDKAGIMTKETLRPDLSADDWEAPSQGLPIGGKCVITGEHQKLLRDLAIYFKSVKSFCRAAKIEIRSFHNWKTKDQISAHGLLKLLALKGLSAELRARIKGLQK